MRIALDKSICSGHAVDSELFPIDEDGYSVLEAFDVPAERLDPARRGVYACPELALSLTAADP